MAGRMIVILMALMLFCGTIIKQEKVFYEINIARRGGTRQQDVYTMQPSSHSRRAKNRNGEAAEDMPRMYWNPPSVNECEYSGDEFGAETARFVLARQIYCYHKTN